MPNRTIKESCRTSPTLAQLSPEAERLHWRLITLADDFGRFEADPEVIRGLCFTRMLDRVKTAHVSAWYSELVAAGIVVAYSHDDRSYGYFKTWEKHNTPRAKTSKYPLPTSANICTQMQANVPVVDLRSRSSNTNTCTNTPPSGADSEFAQFWNAYPKRKAKGDAEKAWKQTASVRPPIAELVLAVERQRLSQDWSKDGGQFIPLPATWLRAHRWQDEDATAQADMSREDASAFFRRLRLAPGGTDEPH